MALLFIDGFNHHAAQDYMYGRKWDSSSSLNVPPLATGGRRGGGAVSFTYFADELRKSVSNPTTAIVGFAAYFSALPTDKKPIAGFYASSTAQTRLVLNPDGTLSFRRGTSTILTGGTSTYTVPLNTWIYIEMKITHSSTTGGVATCNVNAAQVINATAGQATLTGAVSLTTFRFQSSPDDFSTPGDYKICDFYLCDDTGAANNDFLGVSQVDTLYPDADGSSTSFTPSTAGSHYNKVNSATPSLTVYNEGGTINFRDGYSVDTLGALVSPTIRGVQVCSHSFTDTGTRNLANYAKSGATTTDGTAGVIATSTFAPQSTQVQTIFAVDPNTSTAWTVAGINAAEFGVKVAT